MKYQKLFGLDELQQYLFRFCKAILTADKSKHKNFCFYDIAPSILLYGPPNTGKTTLCYSIFDQLKHEVTNELNFFTLSVGRMLDPALGQSSRNLEQTFQDLRNICSNGTSAFLILDEIDMFCMSRSRTQEHDAVRRAMSTLMLELDRLNSALNLIVFGITNVSYLLDTAIVRRFSIKKSVNFTLSLEDFKLYTAHLNQPLHFTLNPEEIEKIYNIYKRRLFTTGDIKNLYKNLLIDMLATDISICPQQRLIKIFENGFSTGEHLKEVSKELL